MRKNHIFLHIPKNGGNTLHSILKRFYPSDKTFYINDKKINDFLKMSPELRREISLLRGHMSFGLHKHLYGESDYFTLLRKPESRVISYYNYTLSRHPNQLYNVLQKKEFSFHDFVTNVKAGNVHNAQIRFISGINDKEEFMLEKALENIDKHFSFVGLLEKYDESLIYLKNLYNWKIPYYVKRNVTKKGKKDLGIKKLTLEIIKEKNNGDYILYRKMESVFKKKISNLSSFNNDLNKLNFYNSVYNTFLFNCGRKLKII